MPSLIAMLPVRNEADRYLARSLQQLERLVDAIVVLDDASSDDTARVCAECSKVELHRLPAPRFATDEAALRRELWRLTARKAPDWVLALDADEIFEDRAIAELPKLLDQQDYDIVAFRIFDFWKSETHVRVDGAWNPWHRFSPLLVRYRPEFADDWFDRPIHCGRFPLAYRDLSTFYSHLRVRHYGWARWQDHLNKYLFYRERDLQIDGAVSPHTESVLSPTIALEPWVPQRSAPWLSDRWEES